MPHLADSLFSLAFTVVGFLLRHYGEQVLEWRGYLTKKAALDLTLELEKGLEALRQHMKPMGPPLLTHLPTAPPESINKNPEPEEIKG